MSPLRHAFAGLVFRALILSLLVSLIQPALQPPPARPSLAAAAAPVAADQDRAAPDLLPPTVETPVALPVTIPHGTPAPARPEALAPADAAVLTAPLPISLTLRVQPAQAQPGDPVTYTLLLTNTGATRVQGLELEAHVPAELHWPGGQPAWYDPVTRLLTATLPALPPHASRAFSVRTQLIGVPEGEHLDQFVSVVERGGGRADLHGLTRVLRTPATGTAGPDGGTLQSHDGRVRVEFPAGALTTTARLEHSWRQLGDRERLHPGGHFFVFDLSAVDASSGQPIDEFNAPVTLTLRVGDLLLDGEGFVLQHYDEATHTWQDAAGPLLPDPASGEAQALITHFSTWGGGSESEEGWKLLLSEPNVGLFNGSLSYSYPLEIPPGVHGLQPAAQLTYNSSRATGLTGWVQSDWAGLGWSGDEVEITRVVGHGTAIGGTDYSDNQNAGYANHCAHEGDLCFNDEFSLLFHGTSYRLVQDLADSSLYHTEDESFLRVERLCWTVANQVCAGVTNQGGNHRGADDYTVFHDYWEVTAQDGTIYRLGARADSEQRRDHVCTRYNGYDANDPDTWHHCGAAGKFDALSRVVSRWRVDQVTDVYNNRMEYHYREVLASEQYEEGEHCDGSPGWCYTLSDRTEWDRASYLEWIGYAWRTDLGTQGWWGYELVFDRRCRGDSEGHAREACSDQAGSPAHDRAADGIDDAKARFANHSGSAWQARVLDGIRVLRITAYDAGTGTATGTIVREVRLSYGVSHDTQDRNWGRLASRVLTGLTTYGLNGYGLSGALPPVTLAYTPLPNRDDGDEPCSTAPTYPYGRLSAIDNGYGARITLSYARPEGGNQHCTQLYNWAVATQTLTDTFAATPARVTSYQYTLPCYANPDPDRDTACETASDPGSDVQHLSGFGVVTVTQRSGSTSGAVLSQSEHHFIPDAGDRPASGLLDARVYYGLMGRETLVRQLDAGSHVLQESRSVYTATVTVDRTDEDENHRPRHDALFVHQDETIQSQYSPGGTLLVQTRAATAYGSDLALTYGKPVAQYAYGTTRVVPNGGFEGASTADGAHLVPAGWTLANNYGGGSAQVRVSTQAGRAVIGNAGLVITHTTSGACECGVWQDVTLPEAGVPYRVSVRVKRAAAGDVQFRLWLQGDGGNPSYYYPSGVSGGNNAETGWAVLSQVITPTAATLRIALVLQAGSGAFYVDDVWCAIRSLETGLTARG